MIYDIAIVGFGPSGAVAAALLGQAGHRVWVCDRDTAVYDKPRAASFDHEVMRIFQQLGIAERVAPFVEPFTDSCHYGVDGQLIRRMTMLPRPHPQAWTPSMVFAQPQVEGVLRDAVLGLPNVQVELGVTVTGLRQSADEVTLSLAQGREAASVGGREADHKPTEGGAREVRARWVIACDGASSTLRGLADLPLDDLGFDEPWLVVDAWVNDRGLAKLPQTSAQFCEPQRPCTFLILTGQHRRWEISLLPGEDPALAATPEGPAGTWALLRRWITPDDAVLWRQASYRFHALVARRWRAGRVFLAGDAAHQQPPFLGQGMCQGLRDVANLAWKLDAVLRGAGAGVSPQPWHEALLNSYEAERSGHVRELSAKLIHIGEQIGERDLARARLRDASLLAQANGLIKPTPRQDVLPRLGRGALASQDSPARGTLFPQAWLQQAGLTLRMDEHCGRGWRLFVAGKTPLPSLSAPANSSAPAGLSAWPLDALHETEGVLAQWFARQGCVAALVRPDHYVFGCCTDAADIAELLAQASPWTH